MLTSLLIQLVNGYRRWVSPLTPGACRFEPSCSRYAILCLRYHGPWRGSVMAAKRICRCNPFFGGGLDLPTLPDWAPPEDREPDWHRVTTLINPSSPPFRD